MSLTNTLLHGRAVKVPIHLWLTFPKSRSEQAPGCGFHPRDKSDTINCGFLGPPWCNKKVEPKI